MLLSDWQTLEGRHGKCLSWPPIIPHIFQPHLLREAGWHLLINMVWIRTIVTNCIAPRFLTTQLKRTHPALRVQPNDSFAPDCGNVVLLRIMSPKASNSRVNDKLDPLSVQSMIFRVIQQM